jgi:hypothetical protein
MSKTNNYTILLPIFNEPIRINAIIANFKNLSNLIVLLDPLDTLTEPILKINKINYIRRPIDYNKWAQLDKEKWMLELVKTEYILIANASMYYPPKILKTFDEISNLNIYDGVKNAMFYWSCGILVQKPWIFKNSSTCYFFKKSSVVSKYSQIHGEFRLRDDSKYYYLEPKSESSIHVFRDDDIPLVTQKHISYAQREANERLTSSKRISYKDILYKPLKSFVNGYFRMGGCLAGLPGLIYHINFMIYTFMVYSYLWELQNEKSFNSNREYHTNYRINLIKKIT